jgi:hypothetical protein
MALTLKEAIQLLESGDWLKHLRFITADINKRVGGKVVEFNKCRIARHQDTPKSTSSTPAPGRYASRITRDPQHSTHFTRNIELANREIRKVHPIIITHINHQSIL